MIDLEPNYVNNHIKWKWSQSVQFSRSVVSPWTAAHQGPLSITNSWSLLELISIESVMPSNQFIVCCPLLLMHSIFPSIRVFSNDLVIRIKWPKYWSFSFSLSNEYSGLISFRVDWFDLLEVQRTLNNFLQNHNSKASVLPYSGFFIVQLSHLNMSTGKNTALTRWTFVSKVMSLLFNMLSRFVIAFLPRASVFSFHGCSHHSQWFWSPRK